MKPYQINNPISRVPFAARWPAALASSLVMVLAGCASSAGIAPVAQVLEPAQLGLAATGERTGGVDAAWWSAWGDEAMSAAIARALESQPSLKVAEARLGRAAAAVGGEEAAAGPKLGATADATRQHFSANSIYPAPLGGSIQTLANAQLAGSWEMDFFGRHRAAMEAALGSERAAQADLQAARNLLAAQVGQTYVQLARLVAQRSEAERSLKQRERMLSLVRERVGAGLDSRVELRLAEGALPEARQQVEAFDEQIVATRHALAALAALPPEAYAQLTPALDRLAPPALPSTLPADLLGRRADISAARWRVEAATQSVQAAKAQFYPNVNLSVFVGLSSIGLDRLVESGSRQYGAGPAIRLPIFDAGALRANLRGKAADVDAAVESYNGAVIEAVRETADQLNALQAIRRQQLEQAQAQQAAESAYDFATQRYGAGLSNHLTLLNAETATLAQRRQAVDLRARALSAQIGLIRALGGGFDPVVETASAQVVQRQ
jgi:NodT family efflux transporter outer membrane factor (OMF) lipoprotein